jgi:hypothetical protein
LLLAAALDFKDSPPSLYIMSKSSGAKPKKKAVMLGVGLDSDGHKRVTTGPNFALVGGTQETHENMTEKAIKINEKLRARGKTLDSVCETEFDDIAHEVGLRKTPPPDRN